MTDNLDKMQNKFSINYFLSKFILTIILSILLGIAYHTGQVSDYNKAQIELKNITIQKYTADFEKYKANLDATTYDSLSFDIFVVLIILFGVFSLYEILGMFLNSLINKIRGG